MHAHVHVHVHVHAKGDYRNRNTFSYTLNFTLTQELPACRNYPMAPVQEIYRNYLSGYLHVEPSY